MASGYTSMFIFRELDMRWRCKGCALATLRLLSWSTICNATKRYTSINENQTAGHALTHLPALVPAFALPVVHDAIWGDQSSGTALTISLCMRSYLKEVACSR